MCGVKDSVSDFNIYISPGNLELFREYIFDRYMIHLNKDYYNTDDLYSFIKDKRIRDIFIKYKFCNVRREHDRCSRWLTNHISNSEKSLKDKVALSMLFRIFNNIVTAELIGIDSCPIDNSKEMEEFISRSRELLQPVNGSFYKYFTNAYSTTGMKTAIAKYCNERQIALTPIILVNDLYNNRFIDELLECENQEEVFLKLKEIPGISSFMGYQLFVDLTYIKEFPFSENEFVVSGPGCNFGIRCLLGEENRKSLKLSDEALLFWLRDNLLRLLKENGCELDLDSLMVDLPEYDRCPNVMMLENCFCEFQKFYRTLDPDESNARVIYHPFDIKKIGN